MAKDLSYDITADDKTKRATDSAAANFEKLQRRADSFSSSKPSKEMQEFSKIIDKSVKDGESAFDSISRSIDETKTHITQLRQEFRQTGSSGIFGDLKSAEADLKRLETVFKEFADEGEKAGQSFSNSFGDEIAESLPKVLSNPVLLAGVVAAVALATGPIAAVVSAAIASGAGLGVIAAAAVIQRNNPQIVAALGHIKADASSVFKDASAALVEPMAAALDIVDELIKTDGPKFRAIFAAAAPAVIPITEGLTKLASDVLPGINRLVSDFSDTLKDPAVISALRTTETTFVGLIDNIGNHPQEIADGFKLVANTLTVVTQVLSDVITIGQTAYNILEAIIAPAQAAYDVIHGHFGQALKDLSSGGQGAAQGIGMLSSATDGLASAAAAAASGGLKGATDAISAEQKAIDDATQAVDDYLNALLGMDNANLGAKQGLANLRGEWEKSKKPIDENTKAGQNNVNLVLQQIANAQRVFDSTEKQTGSVDKATLAYDKQIDSLHKTLSGMGLTESQIDTLIGKYGDIPSQIPTDVKIVGVPAAQAAAKGIEGALAAIKDKTVHVTVRVAESAQSAQLLSRATGQKIAHSDIGANWMPSDPHIAGGTTAPPREIATTVNVTPGALVLDGQLIARSTWRAQAPQRHFAKVGRRYR